MENTLGPVAKGQAGPNDVETPLSFDDQALDQMEKAREEDIAPTSKRDPYIDVMKGVTMLLIIVTHMHSVPLLGYSIVGYIVLLAVPLFFFVTGYLYKDTSDASLPFGRFLAKKVLTVLLPYAIFFALSLLWTETVYAYSLGMPLFGFHIDWNQALMAFVFAGEYLYDFAIVPVPIWFLHALFFGEVVFFLIMRIKKVPVLFVLAVALTIVAIPLQEAMGDSPYWIVDLLPAMLFFMLFGHLVSRFLSQPIYDEEAELPAKQRRVAIAGSFFGMVILAITFFMYLYGGGNMWEITSYWYFPASSLAIIAVFLLCRATTNLVFRYVGRRSLLYLGLHPLVLMTGFVDGLPGRLAAQGFDGVFVFIVYFLIVFLLTTLLVAVADLVLKPYRALKRRVKAQRRRRQELTRAADADASASGEEASLPDTEGKESGAASASGVTQEPGSLYYSASLNDQRNDEAGAAEAGAAPDPRPGT